MKNLRMDIVCIFWKWLYQQVTIGRRVVLIDFDHADPDFHNADEEDLILENKTPR